MADFRSAREVARSVTINDLNCQHRKVNPFWWTVWCFIASQSLGPLSRVPEPRAPQHPTFFAISDSAKIYQNRRSQYAANCRPEVLYHTISRRAVGCFGSRSFCHALRNNIAMADFRSAREVARSVTINDLNCRHRKLNPFTQTLWCYIASPVEGYCYDIPEADQRLQILHRR